LNIHEEASASVKFQQFLWWGSASRTVGKAYCEYALLSDFREHIWISTYDLCRCRSSFASCLIAMAERVAACSKSSPLLYGSAGYYDKLASSRPSVSSLPRGPPLRRCHGRCLRLGLVHRARKSLRTVEALHVGLDRAGVLQQGYYSSTPLVTSYLLS
jgi:hypothetical protein